MGRRYKRHCAVFLIMASAVGGLGGCASSKKGDLTRSERARLYIDVANGALLERDYTGALQNLALAEEEDPRIPELHHSRALAYYYKHDLKKAVESVRKAVELRPTYSEAFNTLGKLLIDDGQYREALDPLLRAAQDPLNREAFKAFTNLGILHYRNGDYREARRNLDQAILSSPAQSCIASYYRGHLNLRESRLGDAIRDYDQATRRICAGFADAQLALGIAYQRNKQYDLARKKFLEVQQRFPKSKVADQAVSYLRKLP